MTANTLLDENFLEHADLIDQTRQRVAAVFPDLVAACAHSIRDGGKILFFGNGGSAADAQHLATELVVRYIGDRAAIAALALTTDTSALTAGGNDLGFERIFARQVEAVGRPGDVAIGLSTSGTSANVLNALTQARTMGLTTVAMTGAHTEAVDPICDVVVSVPWEASNRIQEMHILIGHALCGALEAELDMTESALADGDGTKGDGAGAP